MFPCKIFSSNIIFQQIWTSGTANMCHSSSSPTVPTLQTQTACNMTRRNGKGMGMGRNMKEDDKERMCLACPFKSKFSFSHIFSRTTHGQCTLALQIYEPPSPSMCYTSSAPTTTSPSQMHHHIHQNLTSTSTDDMLHVAGTLHHHPTQAITCCHHLPSPQHHQKQGTKFFFSFFLQINPSVTLSYGRVYSVELSISVINHVNTFLPKC